MQTLILFDKSGNRLREVVSKDAPPAVTLPAEPRHGVIESRTDESRPGRFFKRGGRDSVGLSWFYHEV